MQFSGVRAASDSPGISRASLTHVRKAAAIRPFASSIPNSQMEMIESSRLPANAAFSTTFNTLLGNCSGRLAAAKSNSECRAKVAGPNYSSAAHLSSIGPMMFPQTSAEPCIRPQTGATSVSTGKRRATARRLRPVYERTFDSRRFSRRNFKRNRPLCS